MKVMKKSVALFLALVLSFSIFFCFSCNSVSADVSFPFPDGYWANVSFQYEHPNFNYESACAYFFDQYSNINPADTRIFFVSGTSTFPSGQTYLFVYDSNSVVHENNQCIYLSAPPTLYYTTNFSEYYIGSQPNANYPRSICYTKNTNTYMLVVLNAQGGFEYVDSNIHSIAYIDYVLPPFNPDTGTYSYYYNGVQLVFAPEEFREWILNNNKLIELPEYIVQSKLLSFLEFYQNYGSSASSFFRFIPDWFQYMNIANQSNDNINILKNSIDRLYRQYLDYLSNNHAYWPNAVKLEKSNEIDTKTDNDNQTLVTDDNSDPINISILRDILRGVIAIKNTVYTTGLDIVNSIRNLDFTVNIANDGGNSLPSDNTPTIDYTDQGNFGVDEIHQYEPLPEAPDIDGDVDFLEYPAVLAQTSTHFFDLLPNDMSALMSAVLVLGVLINKIGR